MPITAWLCRGCGGREVPLDHFATTSCGETVCHPDYAAAVLADRNKTREHIVSVTNGLRCVRQMAIERDEQYSMDPADANATLTGTAWHAVMERHAVSGAEVEFRGVIDGIPMVGHADRVRGKIIEDHKHIKTWNLKYKRQGGPDKEYAAQVSFYRKLDSQMRGGASPIERAIIWYHTTDDGLVPMPIDLMDTEEALTLRPYDCDFTVRELYHQAHSWVTGNVEWKDLPLAGQSIKFGKKSGCDYCSVREICTVAAIGSPW